MSVKVRSIALLLSSLITGGGAWLGYELNKPKTVEGFIEWKGLKLASETDENLWKALYFQNKSELDSKVGSVDALKKKCVKLAKEAISYVDKNVEYAEKYCVNTLRSRKARIIAKGFDESKFLSTDEDYKVAFTFNKYSSTFISYLNDSEITKDSEFVDEKPEDEKNKKLLDAYKKYCKNVLEEDGTKIEVAKQLCSKYDYTNAEEFAKSKGYLVKDKGELRKEFPKYKQPDGQEKKKYLIGNSLLEDIKESNEKGKEDSWIVLTKEEDKFEERFNIYCQKQKDRKLFENKFHKEDWPKFKERCLKEDPAKKTVS
ncbi:hypothetical protein A6V39_04000 [Candidatus Mycoplasma haematobovis]|uniref:Uncharacterized protein n=1 Tax=Candidatus Mycoplasma haematobovis TaxID=432608 RepID=A0A1A9QDH4_9MOLU|nr:hypothetical protein [Candidatus Mycoplasma haematobovis]OAL10051.1 hypothetical protein A6V39_04000 [Candidatus Mycoplasma haematobovis]